jgi:hypothetical protein
MNSNKFLLSGIAGAFVIFILGYLTYGMLLTDFMKNHAGTATGVSKNPNEFIIWVIIIANILYGFLLAYIFSKAGISSVGNGFAAGALIGLLTSSSTDCISYATSNLLSPSGMAADIIAFTIIAGIAGVAVAWVRGMGKKATA